RDTQGRSPAALISASGTLRPAERRTVAIRLPGWTASRAALTCGSSASTVRSRSALTSARPHSRAGRSSPPPCRTAAAGSWTAALDARDPAQREPEQPLARGASGETHIDRADPAHRVRDREGEPGPGAGLIGDVQLIDRRDLGG